MSVAIVSSYCSLAENAALQYTQEVIKVLPVGLWVALGGFAYVTHEWYFLIYAHTYIALYLIQATLGRLGGWLAAPVDPSCTTYEWVGPSVEAVLIGAFVTQATVNSLVLRVPITWLRLAWKLLLVAAVVVVPSVNANTSWAQALAGLGLGVLTGLTAMWVLWFVWMPLLPALDTVYLLVRYLKLHSCRDLRNLYYRDMCTDEDNHHWGVAAHPDEPLRTTVEDQPQARGYGVTGHPYGSVFLLV